MLDFIRRLFGIKPSPISCGHYESGSCIECCPMTQDLLKEQAMMRDTLITCSVIFEDQATQHGIAAGLAVTEE